MDNLCSTRFRYTAVAFACVLALLGLTAAGCGGDDEAEVAETPPPAVEPAVAELEVDEVLLGRAIGADRRVNDETDEFAPGDTIYVSVGTEGTENGTLAVRLTFEDGQEVDSRRQSISPNGPEYTEFNFSKPDGWPEGEYTVEVTLDGEVVEEKELEVVG